MQLNYKQNLQRYEFVISLDQIRHWSAKNTTDQRVDIVPIKIIDKSISLLARFERAQ